MADLVYPPVIAAARGLFRSLSLTFPTTGGENIPRTGGAVLASNHVSYLDFMFVGFAAVPSKRLVRFMAKDSIFRNPVAGPLMRGMKHIPVDREAGAASYQSALGALRGGEVVGVFPEATTSRSYTPKDFKLGAARMAAQAGVPLIPMVTWGGQRIWTKGHKRTWRRGTEIALSIGEPLHPTLSDDAAEVTAELKARVQALWQETVASYSGRPDSPEDTWWIPRELGGTALTPEEAREVESAEARERREARRKAKD